MQTETALFDNTHDSYATPSAIMHLFANPCAPFNPELEPEPPKLPTGRPSKASIEARQLLIDPPPPPGMRKHRMSDAEPENTTLSAHALSAIERMRVKKEFTYEALICERPRYEVLCELALLYGVSYTLVHSLID